MNYLPPSPQRQFILDEEHLRLLSIFHYLVGGLAALFGSMFLFHAIFGLMIATHQGPMGQFIRDLDEASPGPTPAVSTPFSAGDDTPASQRQSTVILHHRQELRIMPPRFIGWIFAGMGAAAVLVGWTVAALMIFSGRSLAQRRRRGFSLVVAGISCFFFPFGTALGVFTFVVLLRPSVEWLYQQPRFPGGSSPQPPSPPPLPAL